jgi:hypothetical protein
MALSAPAKAAVTGLLLLTTGGSAIAGDTMFPMVELPRPHLLVSAQQPVHPSVCHSADQVTDALKSDQSSLGGRTVALTNGLDQAFSDAWRRRTDLPSVPVTLVVGHAFADPGTSDVLVDTIEFGDDGCAITRTMLTVDAWNAILQSAVGIKV